jgi:phosphoesterase RecJ-like protein
MTKEIASPLYAAMSSDTGGFMYSSATPDTYRAAAQLMECGIDYSDINHKLFNSKSEKQIKAEGFVAEKMIADGNISYAAITLADRECLGINAEDFETAIDVVRARIGTEIAFVLKEQEVGKYRVSLRSVGFNVADVAKEFSGGGHIRAAGCSVSADSAEAAAALIIKAIRNRG